MADTYRPETWPIRVGGRMEAFRPSAGSDAKVINSAWEARAKEWAFYEQTLAGGPGYVVDHLFTHARELGEDFAKRQERAYFKNRCRPILKAKNAAIYQRGVTRRLEGQDEAIARIVRNVDGRGTHADQFFQGVQYLTMAMGVSFVLVHPARDVRSRAALIDAPPPMELVHPMRVVNWQLAIDGWLDWALICRPHVMRAPWQAEESSKTFELWTREAVTVYDHEGRQIGEEVPHGATMNGNPITPLVPFFNGAAGQDLGGESELADIAYLNRSILNKSSLLDEILYRQTFAQPVVEGQELGGTLPHIGGIGNLLVLYGQARFRYESPPPANAQMLLDTIRDDEESIRAQSLMDGGGASQQGSGIALSYRHRDLNSDLSEKASAMQDGEGRAFGLVLSRIFDPVPPISIEYAKSFEVRTVSDDLDEATRMLDLGMGPTFEAEVKMDLAERKLRRRAPQVLGTIKKELEEQPARGGFPAQAEEAA